MNDEQLHYRRLEISDQLAYLMLYAPEFPSEDQVKIAEERTLLFTKIAHYERAFPAAAKHPRFPLFRGELETAFDAAAAHASNVTRLFQIAAERFEETFRPPPKGPDFTGKAEVIVDNR